jgi:hypothetical protein
MDYYINSSLDQKENVVDFVNTKPIIVNIFIPKPSDFLFDLRRSLVHQRSAKLLDISTCMPAIFENPYASRS